MAVVFISPKKKQKTFVTIIASAFLGFLIIISLWVFLSQPEAKQAPNTSLNKAKININFATLDSSSFKGLEKFDYIPLQFKYIAITSKNKVVQGFISAASEEEARQSLEGAGLTVDEIEQADVGRENPFIPY